MSILKNVNPHLLARGHARGIHFGIARFRGVAIAANAVAVLKSRISRQAGTPYTFPAMSCKAMSRAL